MEISFNGLNQPSQLICLTNIPNILRVSDGTSGSKAAIVLQFSGNLASVTTSDRQWSIQLGSESVQSVLSAGDVQNRNFRAMTDPVDTAASVARALRSCGTAYATWQIRLSGDTVTLIARNSGQMFGDGFDAYFASNIGSSYLSVSYSEGSEGSQLQGSLIDAEIEDGDGNLITTLEKTFISESVSFDLSPTLTTMAEDGECLPFSVRLSSYRGGDYSVLGEISGNWLSEGYKVLYSDRYLTRPEGDIVMAQWLTGGESKMSDEYNSTPLYTYFAQIPVWFYNGANNGGMTIKWECLDSAEEVISSGSTTWRETDSSKPLKHIEMEIRPQDYSLTWYYDITLGNTKIRYRVIKPLNAADDAVRVYWLNEFGGTSFFDFTGGVSDSDTLSQETYRKGHFDYYDSDWKGTERQYGCVVRKSVTMRSHLIGKDATLIFASLIRSPKIWFEDKDGLRQILLLNNMNVEQTEQNGVYRASVSFNYSREI